MKSDERYIDYMMQMCQDKAFLRHMLQRFQMMETDQMTLTIEVSSMLKRLDRYFYELREIEREKLNANRTSRFQLPSRIASNLRDFCKKYVRRGNSKGA